MVVNKTKLLQIPLIGFMLLLVFRIKIAMSYLAGRIVPVFKWVVLSKETTNFTYDLTDTNKLYLASLIADILNKNFDEIMGYIKEIEQDAKLKKHIQEQTESSDWFFMADSLARYGRRIGWYSFIRAKKPKVVVETGIDKGLGSCVITSALMKNNDEGYEGYYYGTDINPKAGYLLSGDYQKYGEILYGDSIKSLEKLNKNIDIFINDSDHSSEYEANEYKTVNNMLSPDAIILGDNSHCTDKLFHFAQSTGRKFLFFKEDPINHWYSGGGIGIAFKRNEKV